jgi:hypothetical protein
MPTRTPIQLELIGHVGGTIEAMVVRGRYAYVGGEYGFSVLDVSNPSQVVEVGYLVLPVADLEVVGKYAYVAAKEAGLQVVDISDPLAPLRVGAYVTSGEAVAIAVESGESRRRAYLSIAKKGLWMIDVSDAAKPIEIGSYKLDAWIGDVSMLSIDAAQTFAYLATSDGLRVVNVSVPQSPVDVASLFRWAGRVIVQGGFAYVIASDDDSTFENVHIVNVSNPVAPAVVGRYSSCVRDIALTEEEFIYIVNCDGSEIVSVSDPTKPAWAASSFPDYTPCDFLVRGVLAVAGNQVYAVNWQGLHIIDVSDPVAPTSVGLYNTLPGANNLVVSDEYAYVVGGVSCNSQAHWGQMNLLDVSNPVRPAIVETYKLPYPAYNVVWADRHLYIPQGHCSFGGAYCSGGLTVSDSSSQADLAQASYFDVPLVSVPYYELAAADSWLISDVAVAGNHVFAVGFPYSYPGNYSGGMQVLRMTGWSTPTAMSVITSGLSSAIWEPYGITVANGGSPQYAYIADYNYGLRVVDILDPLFPIEIGSYEADEATDVAVLGHYAYIARSEKGLLVLDISDPAEPAQVFSYHPPGSVWRVIAAGSYAYVTALGGGLRVLDIADLADPFEIGFYKTPMATGVWIVDDHIYMTDVMGGLFVLRIAK